MRGVWLDVGHGEGSFSWRVAQLLVDMGEAPDVISTGLHTGCVNGPTYNLVTTLNKFLYLGFTLEDVILRATANPAEVLGRPEGLGSLGVGGPADISILDYVEGPFELMDCHGVKKVLDKGLVPELAVCRGKVLEGGVLGGCLCRLPVQSLFFLFWLVECSVMLCYVASPSKSPGGALCAAWTSKRCFIWAFGVSCSIPVGSCALPGLPTAGVRSHPAA